MFSLLTRLLVAREGNIRVAGFDMARSPRAALARIGVVFQQPTLDLDLSVQRNLRYFAGLHGMSGRPAAVAIAAALDRLGMAERAGETVRALNGGHRRRMEIARALIHGPQVLLLDEPTVGLDAAARRAITGHVHDLADSRHGGAVGHPPGRRDPPGRSGRGAAPRPGAVGWARRRSRRDRRPWPSRFMAMTAARTRNEAPG